MQIKRHLSAALNHFWSYHSKSIDWSKLWEVELEFFTNLDFGFGLDNLIVFKIMGHTCLCTMANDGDRIM